MLDRHGETLKTLVGMGFTTPRVSCFSIRASGADGISLPPGFLLPVKEQVVDPNDPFRVVDFLFCN
jgi:hypothetical protein